MCERERGGGKGATLGLAFLLLKRRKLANRGFHWVTCEPAASAVPTGKLGNETQVNAAHGNQQWGQGAEAGLQESSMKWS